MWRIFVSVVLTTVAIFSQSMAAETRQCQLFDQAKQPTLPSDAFNEFYDFGDKILLCASTPEALMLMPNAAPIHDYMVIRSHIGEIDSVDILASTYGYHLTRDSIDCHKLHCDHINSIPLQRFSPPKAYQAPSIKNRGDNIIQQAVDRIDSNMWLGDDVTLSSWSRQSGSDGNNSAKDWIVTQMTDLNLQVSTPEFDVFGTTTQNIIGAKIGSSTPDDWYIIGAHMDSIPSSGNAPGALDNASGCAGVLELARVASYYTFDSSLFFICFSGEEQGLIGSQNHVDSIIANNDQNKVKAALTMDMIGYTSNGQHRLLIESSASNQWLIDILAMNAATFAPQLTVVTSTNPFGSDHVPYINNDMHGILSIDVDWDVYPDYHRSTDMPENLNLTQAQYILQTNMAALAQLAGINGGNDVIFANGFEQ